jgi:hypothetical protein
LKLRNCSRPNIDINVARAFRSSTLKYPLLSLKNSDDRNASPLKRSLDQQTSSAFSCTMAVSDGEPEFTKRDFRELSTYKGKRINFVPAQSQDSIESSINLDTTAVGDSYLALVLSSSSKDKSGEEQTSILCEICKLPLDSIPSSVAHEASIAHQVCLTHSHPPSSIDRSRKGLSYLQSYGWDPDSRSGLGAANEGILFPIKAKEKNDHAGIGALAKETKPADVRPKKMRKLDAKQVRKMEAEDRKKRERLQRMFYTDDVVEKYLGPNA